jgi:hypothetical protein
LHWFIDKQDVDTKPLQSIGRVGGILLCVMYWVLVIAWHTTPWSKATYPADISRTSTPPSAPAELLSGKCKGSRLSHSERRLSACDLDANGVVDECDVNIAVAAALKSIPCEDTADLNRNGICDVGDVQRVLNAARGGKCVVGTVVSVK